MKTFVIYVKGHTESEKYADECVDSFKRGYDVKKIEGVTPVTLNRFLYSDLSPMKNSRAQAFLENVPKREKKDIHLTKKSCFLNHVRIWSRAIELNEPVLFIEHDSICVRDWDFPDFTDVLILNALSAPKQKCLKTLKKGFDKAFAGIQNGIHDYSLNSFNIPLIYNKDNKFKGGAQIPGTAAYGVTPKAAKKLLGSVMKNGWEQSDYFINSKNVKIQFAVPEYFTFNSKPNLELSHSLS